MKKILNITLALLLVFTFLPTISFAESEPTQFGTVEMYSTATPGKVLTDSYYFNDEWFSEDPETENLHLALLSMQLVASASADDVDDLGGDFLRKLGFSNINFTGNSDPSKIDCNYTYGTKTLSDGTTLVAVAVQSYAFDSATKIKGWNQNFTVMGDSIESLDHYAFNTAANNVLDDISSISNGNVKYWITGQSRGGALADVIAAKLPDKLGERNKGIYAYTFESPSVATNTNGNYNYIHNYICSDDVVPMVPPWGMKLYGVTHYLDDVDNETLQNMLTSIGSDVAVPENYDINETKLFSKALVSVLEAKIPSQKSYVQSHSDTAMTEDGEVSFTYSYQTVLQKLSDAIFSGALGSITADTVFDNYTETMDALKPFIKGYLIEKGKLNTDKDASYYYWTGAVMINEVLQNNYNANPNLSNEELYVLLKTAAPALINEEAAEYESDDEMPVLGYLAPALNARGITFSHNFDTVLARLKAKVPAINTDNININIPEPKAEDSATKTPRKLKESASTDYEWLSASAKWNTSDNILKNNKKYYLVAEFALSGHNAPTSITINNKAPISTEISEKDGSIKMTGVWEYTFGTPTMYNLSFYTEEKADTPEDISVEAGTALRYSNIKPADPQAEGYRFDGWFTDENKGWDDLVIDRNTFVNAKWTRILDKLEGTFEIPCVGEEFKEPVFNDTKTYRVDSYFVRDEDYNTIEKAENTDKLILECTLCINKKNTEFKLEPDEWGGGEFVGEAFINGEKVDTSYNEDSLTLEYSFNPKKKTEPSPSIDEAAEAEKFITGLSSNTDVESSNYAPLFLKMGKTTKTSIQVKWKEVPGAEKYMVFSAPNETKFKKLATVRNSSYTSKKLKKGKYYKFVVVALDKNNKVVSTSKNVYIATKGSKKAANYKSIQLKVKKKKYKAVSKLQLKKGKSISIISKTTKPKKTKVKSIIKARYYSTNPSVAIVSNGKIKSVGKGVCRIYVYAQNGVTKSIKVIVK